MEIAESELLDGLLTLEKAKDSAKEAEEVYKVLEKDMKSGKWDENPLLVKRWLEKVKRAVELFMMSHGGAQIPYPFTDELIYPYDFGCRKGGVHSFARSGTCVGVDNHNGLNTDDCSPVPKWKIRITVQDAFYDNSELLWP